MSTHHTEYYHNTFKKRYILETSHKLKIRENKIADSHIHTTQLQ